MGQGPPQHTAKHWRIAGSGSLTTMPSRGIQRPGAPGIMWQYCGDGKCNLRPRSLFPKSVANIRKAKRNIFRRDNADFIAGSIVLTQSCVIYFARAKHVRPQREPLLIARPDVDDE